MESRTNIRQWRTISIVKMGSDREGPVTSLLVLNVSVARPRLLQVIGRRADVGAADANALTLILVLAGHATSRQQ